VTGFRYLFVHSLFQDDFNFSKKIIRSFSPNSTSIQNLSLLATTRYFLKLVYVWRLIYKIFVKSYATNSSTICVCNLKVFESITSSSLNLQRIEERELFLESPTPTTIAFWKLYISIIWNYQRRLVFTRKWIIVVGFCPLNNKKMMKTMRRF
jgi:hypothetical protein